MQHMDNHIFIDAQLVECMLVYVLICPFELFKVSSRRNILVSEFFSLVAADINALCHIFPIHSIPLSQQQSPLSPSADLVRRIKRM